MITKTLKHKVIAGAVAFSMVGGVGTVFATSDAGNQLLSWYNNTSLPQAVTKVTTGVTNYAKSLVGGLYTWYTNTTNNAVGVVTKAGTDETSRANKAISDELKDHKDAIAAKQLEIETAMPGLFDDGVNYANGEVDKYANQGETYANGEISKAVEGQYSRSLKAVQDSVGGTRDTAVADLTSAITAAKNSISAKVNTEVATATGEINKHIDDKIAEKKPLVEGAANTLAGEKKDLIEAEGQKIEGEAKDAMDALVADITK